MNDVFISYAHIDDKALSEGQKGWISQFHRALEVRLGQLLGEEARIWRDPKLQGGDLFDDKLVSQFLESKVLVSVVTPRYVRSEWCQREVQEFWKGAEERGGLKVGDKSRIFKVVKTPVPPEVVPPVLNDLFSRLLGFEFYEVDSESGRIREYDESFGERAKQRYFERIYDLAQEISTVIRVIQAKEGGSLEAGLSTSTGGKTIYLAATTSDQIQNRDQLRRELGAKGHTILPDCPLPMVEDDLRALVREMLSRSDFAIHPIGGLYGIVPEGAEESVIAIQNTLAAEASRHGLKRIIWLPTGTEIHDERQQALVKALMEDSDAHLGAELIRDTIENLKDVVLTRLKPQEKSPAALPEAAGGGAAGSAQGGGSAGGPPLVYLICDPADEEAIEPLEDFLFDQGFEVSHPDFEAEETEAAEQHREMLRDCDAVLVYYGAARQAWVDIKLRGLAKAIGYGRSAPIAVQAVCIAPPEDRRKDRFRTHNAEIIRQESATFDSAAFASFVAAVKAAKPQSGA